MSRFGFILRSGEDQPDGPESGQALVELALTLPMLFIMMVGVVQVGLLAYAAIEVANSAKAAAQYGAQNAGTAVDTATMQTLAVNEAADYGITLDTPISVSTPACSCISAGVKSACGSTTINGVTRPSCASGYLLQTITITTQAHYTPLFSPPGIGPFILHGSAVQEVLF